MTIRFGVCLATGALATLDAIRGSRPLLRKMTADGARAAG